MYFSPSLCKPGGLVSHGRPGVAVNLIRWRLTKYLVPTAESGSGYEVLGQRPPNQVHGYTGSTVRHESTGLT